LGFSLVEMMTVLIILGLVVAAAVPGVGRYMQHDAVRTAADEFKSRCQIAQQRTLSTRLRHRVIYSPSSSSYYLERHEGGDWTWAGSDTVHLTPNVSMEGGVESDPSRHIVTFEPLGTVAATDVPALVQFFNERHDTSSVSIVRTGRMIVRHN
jgi:type II secretion system protein H